MLCRSNTCAAPTAAPATPHCPKRTTPNHPPPPILRALRAAEERVSHTESTSVGAPATADQGDGTDKRCDQRDGQRAECELLPALRADRCPRRRGVASDVGLLARPLGHPALGTEAVVG